MLRQCLERLTEQAGRFEGQVEVLVCDDGRDDSTCCLVKNEFSFFHWHEGPKRGPAANRNMGAAKATGDWLVFLDDDCLPSASFLQAYIAAIGSTKQGRIALEGPTFSPYPSSLLWEAPHNPNGGTLISCNFAIPRSLFLLIGGFDDQFPVASFEDTEFHARLLAFGGLVQFVPNAAVEHPLRRIQSASGLAKRWQGKAILSLHYGASPFHVMLRLPWHVFRVIQSRFRGKPLSPDNTVAVFLFAREWLLVCWQTPGWVRKQAACPQPEFWVRHFTTHGPIAKHGF